MTPAGRPPRRLTVALVGVLAVAAGTFAGGSLGFVAQRTPPASAQRSWPAAAAIPPLPPLRPVVPQTLLAWTPGGLPPGLGRRVARLRGVARVVGVVDGIAWLTASFSPGGEPVDRPPRGLAVPIEVGGADPAAYAPFLGGGDRALRSTLARGQAVLGQTSARLRHLGVGSTLVFGAVRLRVAGIVADTEIGANELFVSRRTAARLGIRLERYLLIEPAPGGSRTRISAGIRAALPPGVQVQIRGSGETPYLRQGDAVLPQSVLKELLGEFAARPVGGYLVQDPAWVRAHIVTATVPIIGRVRCNRALIPQLRGALAEVQREGLASLLDPAEYGGCYSPRFVNRHPSAGISHHAWGAAIDLDVRANHYGRTPRMDPRIVAVFGRWGFTWGGSWVVPDGMHFEFVRFPGPS
jgi:D-alanyl-D-alanine carboxypeptidase